MKDGCRWLMAGLVAGALVLALASLAPWYRDSLAQGDTIYVDADAMGANNGTSWADAFTTLQPALDEAGTDDEIWVAEGVYTPTLEFSPGDPRSATFQMKNGVAIYGGFDPSMGGTEWEDRDWVTHETILSGEIGTPGASDNSYHVFYHPEGTNLDSSASLDGFTISDGFAWDDLYVHVEGGGMYNYSSSPALSNCTFVDNRAQVSGGGMYNYSSLPALTNCTFAGNGAVAGGGGMYNNSSSPVLTNCTFEGNGAFAGGGGMDNYNSSPTLTNCTFTDNSSEASGGGMDNNSSSPVLTNCTFAGNEAGLDGGGMLNSNSSPVVTNCIFWDNSPGQISNSSSTPTVIYSNVQGGYTGVGNIDADPLFVDAASGDFHLGPESPCIDAGDNDAPDLPEVDFEGDPRIMDGDRDGTAIVDMGVDEAFGYRVCLPLLLRAY